jgi:hypothetical protein
VSFEAKKAEITTTVASLRRQFDMPLDPHRKGPVLLSRFLSEFNLVHITVPKLTRGEVIRYLLSKGFPPTDLGSDGDPEEVLAGCLLTSGADGFVFVGQCEPGKQTEAEPSPRLKFTTQPRQRFTAAHELGHFVLHRDVMGRFYADTHESVVDDQDAVRSAHMEQEANYFAADLLMPAEVCRARADAFRAAYKICPRTPFAYHLAAELLVSPEALRHRLRELEVGDE